MHKWRRNRFVKGLSTVLAAIVVFVTTYSLILPAISIEYRYAQDMPGFDVQSQQDGLEGDISENAIMAEAYSGPADDSGNLSETGYDGMYEEETGWGDIDVGDSGFFYEGSDDNGELLAENVYDTYDNEGEIYGEVNSLTASVKGTDLRLDFEDAMPEDSELLFKEIDPEFYNNYYKSAGQELKKQYPNWEIYNGSFYSVEIPYGRTAVKVSFEFEPAFSQYLDEENKVIVIDWCDGEWHHYDPEKTDVFREDDGAVYAVKFETDALYKGMVGFGIITLCPEGSGELEVDEDSGNETNNETYNTAHSVEAPENIEGDIETYTPYEAAVDEESERQSNEETGYESEQPSQTESRYEAEQSGGDVSVDASEESEETDYGEIDGNEERTSVEADPEYDGAWEEEEVVYFEENVFDTAEENDMEEEADAVEAEEKEDILPVAGEAPGSEEDNDDAKEELVPEDSSDDFVEENSNSSILPETMTGEAGSCSISIPGADYMLDISYGADAGIPENAVFTAVPVNDEKYESQALELVGDNAEAGGHVSLIDLIDLVVTVDGKVIAPSGDIQVTVRFNEDISEDEQIYAVHFPGTGEQPEIEEEEEQNIPVEPVQADTLQINADTADEAADTDLIYEDESEDYPIYENAVDDVVYENAADDVIYEYEVDDDPANEDTADDILTIEDITAEELLPESEELQEDRMDVSDLYTSLADSLQQEAPIEALTQTLTDDYDNTESVLSYDDLREPELFKSDKGSYEISFTLNSFSYIAILSYTVDFHYEINGKMYDFSIPGGGFVSLEHIVEVLRIATTGANTKNEPENAENGLENTDDLVEEEPGVDVSGENGKDYEEAIKLNEVNVSEATKTLVADVESVEFSNPELVWVVKVDEDNTVGGLKEANGLDVEYSAELTEEQIAEINAQTVEAGDWALIGVQPFTSEEMLTVTMKNGDQFVVKVTDAQNPSVYIDKTVIIYDNGEQRAMLSSVYTYDNHNRLNSTTLADAETNDAAHWTVEQHNGNYYLKSSDNRYLTIDGNNVGLVNNWSVATPLTIQAGTNPDYRIYAANNSNNVLSYSTNNDWGDGYFSAPGGKNGSQNREWLYIKEVETVADRAGDWLLYFDDDFDDITIHVGETISLRPYNKWEWKEGNVNVQTSHWNIGGRDNNYWNQIDISDANGAHKESWDDGGTGNTAGFHWIAYVKEDGQLDTHYWAVQGQATQTGDYVLTNTKNRKTITVHVVDGNPVNKPSTIDRIANIKVNLFDYDNGGALDVGLNNSGEANHNLANDNNYKNESVNQMGGSDHFYFLSSGSGNNDNESWNSYTKDSSNPGIVQDTLNSEGYPVLDHGNHTSLQYLFDTSQASQSWHGGNGNNGMIAYPDVVGMFQQDSQGYYYFNSNTNYFYYDTATGTSKLYKHTYTQNSSASKGSLANDKPIGFFPFHDYNSTDDLYVNQNDALNHHVGLSMELEFMLPGNKLDDYKQPIIFDFSGDDDLWVFVEWEDGNGQKQSKLLLDLGGVHQPIHGDINFTNGSNTAFMETNRPYTLKVYYLERGGCDSNCSIRFNLPIIQDLTVAKKLTGLTEVEKAKYKDEEFTYEILVNGEPYNYPNPNNRYEKAILLNAAGEDITPENFTITNGRVKIKDGQTLTITYLDRSDTFSVAELNTPNMENFEVPNAERYYHLERDASLYEEEISLQASQTVSEPRIADWVTPTYKLEDTERVTFTNTLKEKNLEVEKKWKGEKTHPDSITFTVSATVDDGHGGRTAYAVKELKEEDGITDKVFTLSNSNDWRQVIEHLPVNTPDGKFIFYDINEGKVEGYTLTGLKDLTAESYNYCNVDVVKLWPDSNVGHTEVLKVVLMNSERKYYAGINTDGEAFFSAELALASVYELKPDNNYTHRFARVPAGEYTAVQLQEDEYSKGLATYIRNIIQYELENSPTEGPVGPEEKPNTPEIHKRIDALRDGAENPDSPHSNEDKTDLYRLYLDYKINSLQEASGVDLLFVIDHSGSMNNSAWQGNPYRAPAVEAALNGEDGLISEFLAMNDKNQWAAVGFKGPDGARDYRWSLGNPWQPVTALSAYNAGKNGSEVLSYGGETYVFTRNDVSAQNQKNVTLENEGANILTNYTAGLWRAEQFLLKQSVKDDERKKVIVFISDGIPTLHIQCPSQTLQGAGVAAGSPYYRDAYGGCPTQTLTEFGYFVDDMTNNGYKFGDNMELYTIGFGGTMQTESGSQLLNSMLDTAYGEVGHSGHFITISDTITNDYNATAENLKNDLRTIMGMNEKFTNIVIQDDLSRYVDLYRIADVGTDVSAIMQAAKAKVTMKVPDPNNPGEMQIVLLYENGAPVNRDDAKFTKADGTTKASIISRLEYDASSKTVKAIFDPEYQAVAGAVYTLSFDVKATEQAYNTYASSGYDKYKDGDNQGKIITGDPDTDFLGTDPDNATSVDKEGFRSNDEAKATYTHNGEENELEYPHPVIQVAAKVDIVKTDQTGAALEGAKFNLYDSRYDASKTIEENEDFLIEADLQSKKPAEPVGEDAVIRSGKLSVGTYYLVETKAPNGYIALSSPMKIIVTEQSGILSMTAQIADENVGADKLNRINRDSWKLSVQNSAGYELPSTGGSGTQLFTILGSILILGASVLLLKRRMA